MGLSRCHNISPVPQPQGYGLVCVVHFGWGDIGVCILKASGLSRGYGMLGLWGDSVGHAISLRGVMLWGPEQNAMQ